MSILLLAECWPYRNIVGSFDNSQTRLLANCCGITVTQLMQLCDCKFVIDRFVPSFKRTEDHEYELYCKLARNVDPIMCGYDISLFIGKRLMTCMCEMKIKFCEEYYTFMKTGTETTVACIPNPLARIWWNETANIAKVKEFMLHVFEQYGN
jgi:hypothetical protein